MIRPQIEGSSTEHALCQDERNTLLANLEDQIVLGLERVRIASLDVLLFLTKLGNGFL